MRIAFPIGFAPLVLGIGLLSVLSASPARAQNLLTNGSFENGPFVDQLAGFMTVSPGSTVITGWEVFSDDLAWGNVPNGTGIITPFGTKFIDFTAFDNAAPHGGVRQTIAATSGANYVLSFFLGTLETGFPNHQGPITVRASVPGVTQDFTFDPPPGATGDQWGEFTLPFTASSANATISLLGISGLQHIGIDNVSVVAANAAAPEPATSLLLLAAAPLVLARRRRPRP
jgi:hypothetical protein